MGCPRRGLDEAQDALGPASSLSEGLWQQGAATPQGRQRRRVRAWPIVSAGCHNTALQMGGGNSGYLVSRLWRPEVRDQDVGMADCFCHRRDSTPGLPLGLQMVVRVFTRPSPRGAGQMTLL